MTDTEWQVAERAVNVTQPLLIAEVASAHDGRVEQACALVRAIAAAGGEAIKFQFVIPEELLVISHPQYAFFQHLALDREAWRTVVAEAHRAGLLPMADLFGMQSFTLAQALGITAFKIPSTALTDPALVLAVAALHAPTLLSVAGALEEEIVWVVDQFRRAGHASFALLHGFQGFPTPVAATHLRRLTWLQARFHCPVGLSDHVPGDSACAQHVPLVALGLGACIIEKHVTLNRRAQGPDWISALEPEEFGQLQQALREAARALGPLNGQWMDGEAIYRQRMRKRVVTAQAIAAGEILTAEKLAQRRSADTGGLDPLHLHACVIGKKLLRPLPPQAVVMPDVLIDPVVAVLIAVRMKSARLPRKALADLHGRAVIERLIERLRTARRPDHVIVCTSTLPEDHPLVELAGQLGVKCVCGDPDDVMARFLQAADEVGADVVVRVTGDNPLTDAETIDRMITAHLAQGAEYTYTEDLPFGTRAEVITVPALRRVHAIAEDPSQTEYMTLYLKQPGVLRVHRYVVDDPQLVRPHYRLTLDMPEDLRLLQAIYQQLSGRGVFPLSDVIQALDRSPELVAMNANVRQRDVEGRINARLRGVTTMEAGRP